MSADDTKSTSRTNWDKLRAMDDSQIDYSDIPPLDDAFFARAKLVMPNAIQLDPDIIRWFRQRNADYAEEINQILRTYISSSERAA